MRLLVATNELQGIRSDDYAWTVEGELVIAESTVCADPRCGCARGFSGLASSRATTTAMVVDLPHLGIDALREAVSDYLERAGWQDLLAADDVGESTGEIIAEIVDEHVETIDVICSAYAVGTVLERDGDEVRPRGFAAAA